MVTNKKKKNVAAACEAVAPIETEAAQVATSPERERSEKEGAAVVEKHLKPAFSVLEKAGKTAIARHGLKEVFVTSDGQAFPLRADAQHHAADLADKEIIKVTE